MDTFNTGMNTLCKNIKIFKPINLFKNISLTIRAIANNTIRTTNTDAGGQFNLIKTTEIGIFNNNIELTTT